MHEFSVVQELIEKLLAEMKSLGYCGIKEIYLKRGSTFAEGPLHQAFQIMTENTPLDNARLIIDEFNVEYTCKKCGYMQTLTPDDLIGHLFICPECGEAAEIDEAHGLELVRVVYLEKE